MFALFRLFESRNRLVRNSPDRIAVMTATTVAKSQTVKCCSSRSHQPKTAFLAVNRKFIENWFSQSPKFHGISNGTRVAESLTRSVDKGTNMNRLQSQFGFCGDNFEGSLIVACPYFEGYQPVVMFVLQDNEHGLFAMNLTEVADSDLVEAWVSTTGQTNTGESLIIGGSEPGPVFAIHSIPHLSEKSITSEVFLSTQVDSINELAQGELDELKIVFGIQSIDRLQLEREIKEGVWYVLPAEPELIFANPSQVWYHSMRSYGLNTLADTVGIWAFPESPTLN